MTYVLFTLAGQVAEAGKFASAALERNIAIGAIVLLVCAIVAMWLWIRSKDKTINRLHEEYGAKLEKKEADHLAFDKAKSERIAAEMKEKDERGYDQNAKLIAAVTTVAAEMKAFKDTLERVASKLDR